MNTLPVDGFVTAGSSLTAFTATPQPGGLFKDAVFTVLNRAGQPVSFTRTTFAGFSYIVSAPSTIHTRVPAGTPFVLS